LLVDTAVARFEEAACLEHSGLKGRARELAVELLLRPFLPTGFALASGKIVDSKGNASTETDIIIYHGAILPPVMFSERDGAVPVESAFYAIEVKSCLTAPELRESVEKARAMRKLQAMCGTRYREGVLEQAYGRGDVKSVLFAYHTDMSQKDELDRLRENDEQASSDPALAAMCIVGKGYWYFDSHERRWKESGPTPERDEVVEFVSGIVNTAAAAVRRREAADIEVAIAAARAEQPQGPVPTPVPSLHTRARAPLGFYLMERRPCKLR
jgi:hypothetical protein